MAMVHSNPNRRRCRAKTTADGSSKVSSPNWLELPREITAAILQKLTPIEILKNVQMVCTQWQSICKDEPSMWKTIDMGKLCCRIKAENYEVICRLAVDRSCGGLIDLAINGFATNQLLDYVTERCTKIQRLRLIYCYRISDEGLCNVANRLPLLEELELSYCDNITGIALQRFGECCPHLKSLKVNQKGSRSYGPYEHGEAMAIAKHMPELRHLQLFGSGMSKSDLDGILEGCRNLESLDLRQCFDIYVEDSSLRKICDERGIKDVRCPDDSTDDYEYDATLAEDDYVPDDYSPISSDDDGGPDINFYIHHYTL